MNYYEHHIKDYAAATGHLSWEEDLAYTRLLRWYYRKEAPIPSDIKEVCRLVCATTKIQRQAVETVLREFFELRTDGWHKDTCDDVIEAFRAGEPARDAKKKNEEVRLSRHREERAKLFTQLNEAGIHASWNTGIKELRVLVEKLPAAKPETPATATVTQPATAPATLATATQYPDTSTQTPGIKATDESSVVHAEPSAPETPTENTTRKGELCKRLRVIGIDAAPHLEAWTELLPAYSDEEIIAAAESARDKKPSERLHLNYLLPILRDRAKPKSAEGGKSKKFDPVAYVNRNRTSGKGNSNASDSQTVIDGTAERLA